MNLITMPFGTLLGVYTLVILSQAATTRRLLLDHQRQSASGRPLIGSPSQ